MKDRQIIDNHGFMYFNALSMCIHEELKEHKQSSDVIKIDDVYDMFDECMVDAADVVREADKEEDDRYQELVKANWG